MNVGELFVSLGVKGTDKTIQAFTQVKTGLGDVASLSIEAKAGILGALYAFEHLTAASGAAGTNLTNFNALTGISTQNLQQWQYAARQAGVSADEMNSSMKGVQSAMTNMLLGNGQPAGFGAVASRVGLDANKLRDTQYVLQQLQKYAQSVPPELANNILKSFGLGEGVVAGMIRNKFTPGALAKAPTYSNREIGALDRANIAWSNLGNKIEMAVGHFNAAHGGQLVKDIDHITTQVIKLAEAFIKLAETIHVFEGLGKIFEGWSKIFESINFFADALGGDKKKQGVIGENMRALIGPAPIIPNTSTQKNNNININQNLNFQHDGKDHKKTGESVHHAVKGAFRQMPQNGGF